MSSAATTYGLVLALTAAGRPEEAALALDSIWSGDSERIEYVIASAEIDLARGDMGRAVTTLERRLELSLDEVPDGELIIAVDDDGASGPGTVQECSEENNTLVVTELECDG